MNRPAAAHFEKAQRLLAHEGVAAARDAASTTAEGRAYDKLEAHLAPIIGIASVQLLLLRAAKLTQGDFAFLAEVAIGDPSTHLRDYFHARDRRVSEESAAALFGTFIALLTTFIGERLTMQILRSAWPTLDETPPSETGK